MRVETREFYRSENGDRWLLVREPDPEQVFVRHQANADSGGHVADFDVGWFLMQDQRHPEREALLRLIGTLVESHEDA